MQPNHTLFIHSLLHPLLPAFCCRSRAKHYWLWYKRQACIFHRSQLPSLWSLPGTNDCLSDTPEVHHCHPRECSSYIVNTCFPLKFAGSSKEQSVSTFIAVNLSLDSDASPDRSLCLHSGPQHRACSWTQSLHTHGGCYTLVYRWCPPSLPSDPWRRCLCRRKQCNHFSNKALKYVKIVVEHMWNFTLSLKTGLADW